MSVTYPSSHPNDQERFDAEVTHYGRLILKALAGAGVLAALVIAMAALIRSGDQPAPIVQQTAAAHKPGAAAAAPAAAPTLEDAKGVAFEPFERVDPNLPAVPKGAVKRFDVDVYHHVAQVSKDLAPTEVWSYKVNGVEHRGTGFSEAMVVEVGDEVDFKLTNGSSERMQVTLPHSLDFHSAEVDPGKRYADLAPGKSMRYRFTASHPGVFMYHCATQPILMHTGMGMIGAMVVKPEGLAPARDLFINQQEYYIGQPGKAADMAKLAAKAPDVVAFNGYANQYKDEPIVVKRGERIRMWVLNGGPSLWSAFHVIGTVFDKTVVEGVEGRHAQTINLAPSQGAYVEFTLAEEGTYPFVTHAFGDMVKGALGILKTEHVRPEAAATRWTRRATMKPPRARPTSTSRSARCGSSRQAVGEGGHGDLRRQERGSDDARARDREGTGQGRRRDARREHLPAQGQGPDGRGRRDAEGGPRARRLRAGVPGSRPLHGRPEARLHRHHVAVNTGMFECLTAFGEKW